MNNFPVLEYETKRTEVVGWKRLVRRAHKAQLESEADVKLAMSPYDMFELLTYEQKLRGILVQVSCLEFTNEKFTFSFYGISPSSVLQIRNELELFSQKWDEALNRILSVYERQWEGGLKRPYLPPPEELKERWRFRIKEKSE